jgi:superfamily II DNA or RNA helicase
VTNTPIEIPFIGEMRDYQEPVILDFADRFQKGHTDLILSAETGSGKTVMLLKMWSMLKVRALVIVPKSDLMEQWISRIKQFTGLEDCDIGIARQKVCEYRDKKIVVGMIHSLCKDKYPVSFKYNFGLVIFDELHKLGAFTFSKVGGMFPAKYRLGATATLRRSDGLAKVFYSHLGNEVIRPLRGGQPIPKIVVVKYSRSSGKIPHWANTRVKRRGVLFSALAKNPERIDWIARLTKEVYDTGRQTLVIGERILQLENIIRFLTMQYEVDPKDIGLYIGKTTASERKRIAENCKIIMATTSMLSLGTDIPTLRGLIFATPLADVEQPIGRICRLCSDTQSPIVIDFVDSSYPEANRWFLGRLRFYNKKDWEVVYT